MNDTALNEAVAFSLDNQLDHGKLILELAHKSPAHFLELMERHVDAMALSVHMMKLDPVTYLDIAKKLAAAQLKTEEICNCMRKNELIPAIRLVREGTGFGLKESKDIIVVARDQLRAQGLLNLPPPVSGSPMATFSQLTAAQEKVVVEIVSGF